MQLYNETLMALLDVHTPVVSRTTRLRPRTDPWFDSDCRKRHVRRLECWHKRHCSRATWINVLHDYHQLVNEKRSSFWKFKCCQATNAQQAWKTIDSILCHNKQARLADFLHFCSGSCRLFWEDQWNLGNDWRRRQSVLWEQHLWTGTTIIYATQHCWHSPICSAGTNETVLSWSSSDLVIKGLHCLVSLAPFKITHIVNMSLTNGYYVPSVFKNVCITPLLKISGLDQNEACNYRLVSNLPLLSKTLERAVSQQLNSNSNGVKLFLPHQSAYRKTHSTETVLLQV